MTTTTEVPAEVSYAFNQAIYALAEAEERLHGTVAAMRSHGCTWREIGEALGVTRQAAQQRFGG